VGLSKREQGLVQEAEKFVCSTLCLFRTRPYLFIGKVSKDRWLKEWRDRHSVAVVTLLFDGGLTAWEV
jgi:hypothetical protein